MPLPLLVRLAGGVDVASGIWLCCCAHKSQIRSAACHTAPADIGTLTGRWSDWVAAAAPSLRSLTIVTRHASGSTLTVADVATYAGVVVAGRATPVFAVRPLLFCFSSSSPSFLLVVLCLSGWDDVKVTASFRLLIDKRSFPVVLLGLHG